MTTVDDDDIDDQFAAHLRQTLRAVAGTVTADDLADHLDETAGPSRRSPFRRRRPVLVAAAAAVVAVAVLVARPLGSGDDSAWASEAVAVAEAAPRLLVTAEGWDVTRADEFRIERGEMIFAAGDAQLELHWGMGGNGGYQDRLDEWTGDGERLADVTIAGHRAAVFQAGSSAGSVDLVALWPDGDYGVEIRGDFADLDAFLDVAATIEVVDVDTWLSAMPASVVRPQNRAAAVEQILADIPLPAGLDPAELAAGDGSVSDRYQLGARVTGRVACAWIEQWVDATRTGDATAAQEAVDAMATSHQWDILHEMEDDGAWSQVVWEFADALAAGGVIHVVGDPDDGEELDLPVADLYVDAFGCDTP